MSSVVRLGIIGCGRILNAHLRGLRILQEKGYADDFRVTALCARKEIDLQRFNRRGEGPPPRPPPVAAPADPLNAPQLYVSDLHPDARTELYTDYRVMLAEGSVDAFALEQLDFIRAIRHGTQMRMSGREGCLDMALSYAVLESGLAKRSVTPAEILAGDLCEYQREINEHYGLG